MNLLRVWLNRLSGLLSNRRREQDFAAELESHLQLHTDENIRAGMPPAEARRNAILKLGGVEPTRQAYRERGTVPFLETLLQDLRFAIRQLYRKPGFTVTAVFMLTVGIGACVATFAFVDAALIKPLPYPNPTRLVDVAENTATSPNTTLSYADYLDWNRLNRVFHSFDAYTGTRYLLRTSTGTEAVAGERVSDGFFRTLGIAPVIGRDFYSGEDLPSKPRSAILSYATWQKRYAGGKDIIGKTVSLSGNLYTVVGVMPQRFQFAPRNNVEFWTAFHGNDPCDLQRGCDGVFSIARLKDGVSVQTAQSNLRTIAQQLERQYPATNRGHGAAVQLFSELIIGNLRSILLILLGGAALLLLIACVNVSSLLLVRSESRKREIAVRNALGASRVRIARQFITEGFLLVLASTLAGIALAYAASWIILRLIPVDIRVNMPYFDGLGLNLHVLCFAVVVAFVATLIFSLTPILRLSFSNMRESLSEGSRGAGGVFWRRLGANLVVFELAIAVILLVCAGLLGKSCYRLLHVDLNFQPDHLATVHLVVPKAVYTKDEQINTVRKRLLDRIGVLPGVTSASTTSRFPLSGNGTTTLIRFVGRAYHKEINEVIDREISHNYFKTLKTALVRGRFFTNDDISTGPRVVIINQALARQYFPNEDPIGKRIGDTDLSPRSLAEIIGVVDNLREGFLGDQILPAVYYPAAQNASTWFGIIVRTSQDEQSLLPSLVSTIHQVDPGIGTGGEASMTQLIDDSPDSYMSRSSAYLVGGFALLALFLSTIGLYGVIAYSVSQRTREIGVRMALGAQRASVYHLILKEGARLILWGIAVGILCSLAVTVLLRSVLFDVQSWDVATLSIVPLVLAAAALLASYIPARRAASINPNEALRTE